MRTEEKMSYYLTKAKTIENNFEKDIRIAVLSSFTLNGIEKVSHTTFEDGVKYMEFTEAVTRSSQNRQTIALPL